MDIQKGTDKQQSTFNWQIAQTHPLLHNNNSNEAKMKPISHIH